MGTTKTIKLENAAKTETVLFSLSKNGRISLDSSSGYSTSKYSTKNFKDSTMRLLGVVMHMIGHKGWSILEQS